MTALASQHERRLASVKRLRRDRIAWAAKFFRILDKHGQVIPLRANAAQRAVYAAECEQMRTRGYVRSFVLKGRQGGVSTWEQASNLHQIWSSRGFNAMTLAHTREDTDKLFGITQLGVENFPLGGLPSLGGKETREITFPTRLAKFWTGTAGAKRAGRSITLKRVHLSEFALYDKPRATLNAIKPALVPHGSIITLETTASGFDSEAHNFWREAEAGANGYVTVFIPWWLCDVDNYRLPLMADDELGTLEPDEQDLVDRHGLDHEQIKWRRMQIREMQRADFLTEYAEDAQSCWAAAGGMFYDAELLKYLMAKVRQPTSTEWGGALEVYGELPHGERAVGGVDTAEGFSKGEPTKKDRSAFVIRAYPSRRLLVKFEDRAVTPENLAGFLNTWGRKYCGVFWVIEKNAHGITTLRSLRDDYKYPSSQIYHRATQDTANTEASDLIGWHTNEGSKTLLLDYGRTVLHACRDGIGDCPSASALRDCFAIRRDDKGKVELNGRDVWMAEMLAEVGQQAIPGPIFFGRVVKK